MWQILGLLRGRGKGRRHRVKTADAEMHGTWCGDWMRGPPTAIFGNNKRSLQLFNSNAGVESVALFPPSAHMRQIISDVQRRRRSCLLTCRKAQIRGVGTDPWATAAAAAAATTAAAVGALYNLFARRSCGPISSEHICVARDQFWKELLHWLTSERNGFWGKYCFRLESFASSDFWHSLLVQGVSCRHLYVLAPLENRRDIRTERWVPALDAWQEMNCHR